MAKLNKIFSIKIFYFNWWRNLKKSEFLTYSPKKYNKIYIKIGGENLKKFFLLKFFILIRGET